MKSKFNNFVRSLANKARNSVERFPDTVILSISIVVLLIITVHYEDTIEILEKVILTLALGLPLTAIIKLIIERYKLKRNNHIIFDACAGIILLIYYFLIPKLDQQFYQQYIILSIVLYLIFTLIPYLFKREGYQIYLLKLWNCVFVSVLYSIVLYLGIISMIFTVDKLFNLSIEWKIYMDIFITISGVFFIPYLLGSIPNYNEEMKLKIYPKIYKVLFAIILMPIASTYTLILYAYFIKILILKKMPEGILGNLVLWYGLISTIILILTTPLIKEKQFVKRFRKYFPFAIIIPIVMMYIAFAIRINYYGITVARFYALIAGIWILGTILYFILKRKILPTPIVLAATILMVISSYGPYNAYSISIRDQNNRLESYLSELNMIENGELIPSDNLTDVQEEKISSYIRYFESIEKLSEIDILPNDFKISQMEDFFGFEYNYYWYNREYINYYYYPLNQILNVKEIDYIINYAGYIDKRESSSKKESSSKEELYLEINGDDIQIFLGKDNLYQISLNEIAEKLYNKLGNSTPKNVEDVTIKDSNDKVDITFIIRSLHGEYRSNKFTNINIEFSTLIKIKD